MSVLLSKRHSNELFYRYGPDNYNEHPTFDDIILFFSDSLVQGLIENKTWSIVGTFSVVPSPYKQLYTFIFLINEYFFPSIFIIFKNKKKQTCNNMLSLIKTMINGLKPKL